MLKNLIKVGIFSLAASTARDYKTTKLCWEEIDKLQKKDRVKYILNYPM